MICGIALLLADGVEAQPSIISLLLGAAGGTGFAIWTAWYCITRVIPSRETAFAVEREAAENRCQERFDRMMQSQADHFERERLDHRTDMHEAWSTVKEASEKIINQLTKNTEKLDRLNDKVENINGQPPRQARE